MTKPKNKKGSETDSQYLLKLVIYMILGSLWLKILVNDSNQVPIPLGFLAGIVIASHERFQIDRKIEYAVLLVSMFVGFWLPVGVYLNV